MKHAAANEVLGAITVRKFSASDTTACIGYLSDFCKWYSNFPEVAAHETLWDMAQDLDETLCGRFVRIGEQIDDIEIHSFGDEHDLYPYLDAEVSLRFDLDLDSKQDIRPQKE